MPMTLECPALEDDALAKRAAALAKECSPRGPKALAAALGRNKSAGTRWQKGENNPIYAVLRTGRDLARSEATTPAPIIAELEVILSTERHKGKSAEWLIRRWHQLRDREIAAEADEKRASWGEDLEAYEQRLIANAELEIEMASITRILREKKLDPRDYRSDGWPLRRGAR